MHRHKQQPNRQKQLANALPSRLRVHNQSAELRPRGFIVFKSQEVPSPLRVELRAVERVRYHAQIVVGVIRCPVMGEEGRRAQDPLILNRYQGVGACLHRCVGVDGGRRELGKTRLAGGDNRGNGLSVTRQIQRIEQPG